MINYKVTAAISDDVDFPFTAPVNASGPTATDGTEYVAELLTQTWGVFQALLAASGFQPSGTADKSDASEVLDAIVEQAQGRAAFVKESGGSAANAYLVEANTSLTPQGTSTGANGKAHSYFAGMILIFDIAAPNTTISTVDAFGLGAQFIKTPDGGNVVAGDLSGRLVLRYDGTNFIILESAGSYFAADLRVDTLTVTGGVLLPRGYLGGLIISNNVLDSAKDIDVSIGECKDSTDVHNLAITTPIGKRLDAVWAEGGTPATTVGGLFSGSVAASTWYHFFLIRKDSDGSIDAGFDTSVIAANIPVGYTAFRRIGSVLTDGGVNIISFTQRGDEFLWLELLSAFTDFSTGTSAVIKTLVVPPAIQVDAILSFTTVKTVLTSVYIVLFSSLDQTDLVPSQGLSDLVSIGHYNSSQRNIRTNTSGQIRYRATQSGADLAIRATLHGWIDTRGKET